MSIFWNNKKLWISLKKYSTKFQLISDIWYYYSGIWTLLRIPMIIHILKYKKRIIDSNYISKFFCIFPGGEMKSFAKNLIISFAIIFYTTFDLRKCFYFKRILNRTIFSFILFYLQCQMGHLMCAACFTHLLADGRLIFWC